MGYSSKIDDIKKIIKSKKFAPYIKKFSDIRIQDKRVYLECKLHNKHTINFIAPLNSSEIYINISGTNKLPLVYDDKIRHKFCEIVIECLEAIAYADKGDLYIFLYKFYMDTVRYLNSPYNGYDMPFMDKVNLKADISEVVSKLYGYGKKSQYEQMLKQYHDVML